MSGKLLALGLTALLLLPLASPAAGQDEEGSARDCCLLLLVPVGARASALGGAVTARSGADAMFRNPAGLAAVQGTALLLHHADRTVVDVNAFSVVTGRGRVAGGVSYQLFDFGSQFMTDETGQTIGELTYRDHLLVASVGAGIGLGMALGASYRFFQSRIDCRGACGGAEQATMFHALDLGYRYAPGWHTALQFGVSLVNLPLTGRGDDGTGQFPARMHVGAAYDVLRLVRDDDVVALRVALDVQDEVRRPGAMVPSAGLELDVQQTIFLRAGYTLGEGLASGAAVGVELRYDRFDIGVSRSFVSTSFQDEEPFQVSFGVNF
jgi:hypothetical protein